MVMAIFISSVYFEQVLCAEINVLLLPRTHAANLTPRSFVFIKVAPRRQKNGRFGSQLLLSEHNHFSIDENNCFTFVGQFTKPCKHLLQTAPPKSAQRHEGQFGPESSPKTHLTSLREAACSLLQLTQVL